MRYAELVFLVLLVLYQAVLLAPRHKRLFAANYLVFLAGMALAWNLGLEGLRWQTLPAIVLLLLDLAILFPSFQTLRGRVPTPGFWRALGRVLRTTVAFLGFLVGLAALVLAVAFPLPQVDLTGGIPPGQRVVRFPQEGSQPALEVTLWYPAAGDLRPRPRAVAEPETWQRSRAEGGLPVFWQSYEEHLPTSMIVGGRLAAPKTKYPVVYVALPSRQAVTDFAYLFEDLASRGFIVAAGGPLPPPLPAPGAFTWSQAWTEITHPFVEPALWLEPDRTLAPASDADFRWVEPAVEALKQLDQEPGDLLYAAIDWSRQGLWSWGTGPGLSAAALEGLGFRCQVRTGAGLDQGSASLPSLWISPDRPSTKPQEGNWVLTVPRLQRADLADSAYLKPFLAFFGLKTAADAGFHGAIRQYQAAFYQYAFWNTGAEGGFGQTVPAVSGLVLTGR